MNQSWEELEHLRRQYQKLGLLDAQFRKTAILSEVDFMVYPGDQFIPQCTICSNEYQNFTTLHKVNPQNNVQLTHDRCGCLWVDYFKNKINKLAPGVVYYREKVDGKPGVVGRGRSHSARNKG
jgi:hypothetical protein